jgi:hypothetical protein
MLNTLKVYAKTQMINTFNDAEHVMDHAIAASIHALWCAVNHQMQHSPGEIVFQRDMLLDIPVIADLVAIRERRQLLIDENLRRQNEKRLEYHYKVDDWVMIKVYDPKKGDDRFHGPYKIKETRTNGTVVVIRNEEGNVLETYNIRKLKPYTGPAIPARARVVHQAEGQAHYFFVEEANRMEAYIFERSIAGGRECSKLEGLHYWPPNHN